MYLHFLSFLNTLGQLKPFRVKDNALQWHGCWWPGDARSQDMSNNGTFIDLVFPSSFPRKLCLQHQKGDIYSISCWTSQSLMLPNCKLILHDVGQMAKTFMYIYMYVFSFFLNIYIHFITSLWELVDLCQAIGCPNYILWMTNIRVKTMRQKRLQIFCR